MNYTHLGRTGLKVSRLCLGTMNFGDVTDEKTSARILDEALEAGINFIDTADVYGTEQSPDIQQGSGLSEEIIGRWLQQGGRRERIVLATKVYQPMGPGPNDRRLSAYHIRKACEDSLRRLKTDHIDVYQMHHIDRHTPWEEIWQAMELLVQQGKVLYIGSSNFAGWDIATAQSVATVRHFLGLVAEQSLIRAVVGPSQKHHSGSVRAGLGNGPAALDCPYPGYDAISAPDRKQRRTASPVDGQRATRNRCGACQNPIAGRSRRSVYRKSV